MPGKMINFHESQIRLSCALLHPRRYFKSFGFHSTTRNLRIGNFISDACVVGSPYVLAAQEWNQKQTFISPCVPCPAPMIASFADTINRWYMDASAPQIPFH